MITLEKVYIDIPTEKKSMAIYYILCSYSSEFHPTPQISKKPNMILSTIFKHNSNLFWNFILNIFNLHRSKTIPYFYTTFMYVYTNTNMYIYIYILILVLKYTNILYFSLD